MTAEDREEEEAVVESAPARPASVATANDQSRDSDIEEGESDAGQSDDDLSVTSPTELLEENGDERADRVEKLGATEHTVKLLYGQEQKEEEGCPFCVYMKSGACGESFTEWEECVDEAEKAGENVADKCVRVTRLLTQCMRANADYYGAVLETEKSVSGGVTGADILEVATQQAERTEMEAVEVEADKAAQEAHG